MVREPFISKISTDHGTGTFLFSCIVSHKRPSWSLFRGFAVYVKSEYILRHSDQKMIL